jgi:cytochrome c-type biogenesis protein CcmH/NrfG
LSLRPADSQSHFNLWRALEHQGKHAACEAAYREAIRIRPDHAEAHARLGDVLDRLGRVEDALGAWSEAVRLAPSEPRYRHALETLVGRRAAGP